MLMVKVIILEVLIEKKKKNLFLPLFDGVLKKFETTVRRYNANRDVVYY